MAEKSKNFYTQRRKEMNKEEILAMEAGRKLDGLVATEIMGIKVEYPFAEGYPYYLTDGKKGKKVWDAAAFYSTDISTAWKVWLAVTKDSPEDWAIYSDDDGEVTVEHYPDDYRGDREKGCGDIEVDGVFPKAICKAALLAKLVSK